MYSVHSIEMSIWNQRVEDVLAFEMWSSVRKMWICNWSTKNANQIPGIYLFEIKLFHFWKLENYDKYLNISRHCNALCKCIAVLCIIPTFCKLLLKHYFLKLRSFDNYLKFSRHCVTCIQVSLVKYDLESWCRKLCKLLLKLYLKSFKQIYS